MWESNSPVRSFSTAAAAIEASASATASATVSSASPASSKNNNKDTPTKESLAWFRSRQAQWKGSPRPKMQALPPPLPPYTPPKTVPINMELKRPVTVTSTATSSPVTSSPATSSPATPSSTTSSSISTSTSSTSTSTSSTRQQPPNSISHPPSMQRATDAHPFSPMATTRQSQIPTPTTATKQPQKQPELKDDSPATAAIDYRQFLVDFYTKHNPSKLATVEQTLVTYQGRYEDMAAKLTAKYVTKPAAAAVPSPYGLPTGTGPRCFLEFSIGDDNDDNTAKGSSRRVEVQLFADQAPIAVENFRALCTGEMGMCSSNSSSKPLCYRNSQMHRVVPNMCVQGGDFTAGNGTGGESIYRAGCSPHADMWGKFRDEVFLQHDRAGLLSYANNGPNRNGSQFFFTLRPLPHLNGKHVVFGKVIVDNDASDTDGMSVVEEMGRLSTNAMQRPLEAAVIQDCGEILPDGTEIRASQLQNGGGTKRLKEQTSTGAAFTTTATNSGTTASPFGFGLSQGSSSGGMFGASQSPFSTNTSQATTSIFGSGKPKESAFGTGSASGGSSVGTTPFSFSPEA